MRSDLFLPAALVSCDHSSFTAEAIVNDKQDAASVARLFPGRGHLVLGIARVSDDASVQLFEQLAFLRPYTSGILAEAEAQRSRVRC